MSAKWQAPAASVKACQTSWYPNTIGRGSGRSFTNPMAPIDMASGMQTIANQGLHHDPYYIDYIEKPDGTRANYRRGVQQIIRTLADVEVAVRCIHQQRIDRWRRQVRSQPAHRPGHRIADGGLAPVAAALVGGDVGRIPLHGCGSSAWGPGARAGARSRAGS